MPEVKVMMSGNEAIARGAWEAGVKVAAAYPGTPSTEIMENVALYDDIYSEWSPNEKVALEVVSGASIGGVRALAAMKHVGLNVAADPLMTLAYTGVNGGLVIISADDPGMHSSQNEQDNRNYAAFARIPLLQPSNSQEALDMTKAAFDISEQYDTPVLVIPTTRICHGKSPVTLSDRVDVPNKPYERTPRKYVMVPANGRRRHAVVDQRESKLLELSEATELNREIEGSGDIGIITSGVASQYALEIMPNAHYLLLGMPWPLPEQKIRKFAAKVKKLIVIEELEPFLEDRIRAMGIEVTGKALFPRLGELNPELVRKGLTGVEPTPSPVPKDVTIPMRPPVLCAGCPHRGLFSILRKHKFIISGDIGCYTLGALPPLSSMDTCICMGASVSGAVGFAKAMETGDGRKVVGVLGDSTFLHSGITGLLDIVYNKANVIICILDNRITAMTGHQENPATGKTIKGEPTVAVDFEKLARALGINHVYMVDPFNLEETDAAFKACKELDEPSVVVARRECALIRRKPGFAISIVNQDICTKCGSCLKIGCPAIIKRDDIIMVDKVMCYGCGVCRQVCPFDAIEPEDPDKTPFANSLL